MKATMLLESDLLQKNVNENISQMKAIAKNKLYPIEFGLFYKKVFDAEEALNLKADQRGKLVNTTLLAFRNKLSIYENQVMPHIREINKNHSKAKLTAIYNSLLVDLANIEEINRISKLDIIMNAKDTGNIALSMKSIIFDTWKNIGIPLILLLDLKECCQLNRCEITNEYINKLIMQTHP